MVADLPPSQSSPEVRNLIAEPAQGRPFEFGEFFSGMGGYSATVETLGEDSVHVATSLDVYHGWDILSDSGFELAMGTCQKFYHGHFAPPCRTLTMARRHDVHGSVRTLRSFASPEGWGDPEAEEANAIVERMVHLILLLVSRGKTFAVENPWDSYLWCLRCMVCIFKLRDVDLICLHQCPYGAVTRKCTGILTNSSWMKAVSAKCWEVRRHYHLKAGLVGRAWSFVDEQLVWRTSLAAEYPCGLTIAWTRALLSWLRTQEAADMLQQDMYVRVGKWKNTLVLKSSSKRHKVDIAAQNETAMEKRERENDEAVGGLRNAKRAVARSPGLQEVGRRVRTVLDGFITDALLERLEGDIEKGVAMEDIAKVRQALCLEFGASSSNDKLPADLWRQILSAAGDPEKDVLPKWMVEGFPLGISGPIDYTGVFPKTDADTDSVVASRDEGMALQDELGDHTNYMSFTTAGVKAQVLLDAMVESGRATLLNTWSEVTTLVGSDAMLTKMGCIVKVKTNGEEKCRLIFDGRRSSVNGMIHCRERVTLPRVSDVADSLKRLLKKNEGWGTYPMLFSADFRDAFMMLNLRADEKKYVVMKGLRDSEGRDRYYVSHVCVFGLATGPLLWSRLAAAAMRISQSVLAPHEAEVNCFVDDPLVVTVAASFREHTKLVSYYLLVWLSLGLEVAWNKADRGFSLQWIGFKFL